jgi:hypothetical protein
MNLSQRLARFMSGQDDVGDGDRAGIDEGVARNAALEFELDNGIEGTARGLAADAPPQPVADLAQGQRQRKNLGDTLDRKRGIAVARGRDIAFGIDHGEAEGFGVDPCQIGNISRDLAPIGPSRHVVGNFSYDKVEAGHELEPDRN